MTSNKQREKFNLGVTLEKAVQELSQCDPQEVSSNSGVIFNHEEGCYLLPYLNRQYLIYHENGEVKPLLQEEEISLQMRITFLHYLIHADGTPLKGEWITFKELPGGHIYVTPYRNRTIKPLLKIFGNNLQKFMELAAMLGGQPGPFGDVSVIMRPFPKVPVALILWEGDEEFSPSANILYNASAAHYLPTEDYALLPGLIIFEMASMLKK